MTARYKRRIPKLLPNNGLLNLKEWGVFVRVEMEVDGAPSTFYCSASCLSPLICFLCCSTLKLYLFMRNQHLHQIGCKLRPQTKKSNVESVICTQNARTTLLDYEIR